MKPIQSLIALVTMVLAGCATTQGSASRSTSDAASVEGACAYVAADLREGLLFGEHLEIASVRAVHERAGKQLIRREVGAELFVPSKPGLSASGISQAAQCQMARYANDEVMDARDPLAVRGAAVRVKERGEGFVVMISSPDRASAREISERSIAL